MNFIKIPDGIYRLMGTMIILFTMEKLPCYLKCMVNKTHINIILHITKVIWGNNIISVN